MALNERVVERNVKVKCYKKEDKEITKKDILEI